jgi:diguanylate cyclase (GGDEF)-like protein
MSPEPLARTPARPQIGVIVSEIEGEYMNAMVDAVCNSAVLAGVDLIFYPVLRNGAPDSFSQQFSANYEFLDSSVLDGMLFFAATVQCHMDDPDALRQLMLRFDHIPCVVVGCDVPGWPSVTINGYVGFKKLVAHLISVHGHRRIAMIEGPASNTDAQERLAAYLDALTEASIVADPQLRVSGFYNAPSGASGMEELLSRSIKFDALVCANDDMALGALAVAANHGLNVPEDLALGGFDDIRSFSNIGPSLTSVNQDIPGHVQAALGLLLDRIARRPVSSKVRLDSLLVLRHSCGCRRTVPHLNQNPGVAAVAGASLATDALVSALVAGMDVPSGLRLGLEARVIALRDALLAPDNGRQFEAALTQLYKAWHQHHADTAHLHHLLIEVQTHLLGPLSARDMADVSTRLQRGQILLADATELLLNAAHSTTKGNPRNLHLQFKPRVTSDDMTSLLAGLAEGLVHLEIGTCFVALYARPLSLDTVRSEGLPSSSRLVFAMDDGVVHPEWCGEDFSTCELLPPVAARLSRPANKPLQVMPMFHLNEHFGFIVLERQLHDRFPYEELRHEITASLHHCLLVQELAAARELMRQDLDRANNANDLLSHIAMRDALTGLLNRRGFLQLAETVMHTARLTGQTMSLIFADMDGLKLINDTLGHEEGDHAIRQAAQVLQQAFRQEDIVARIGGDEFVALTRSGVQETLAMIETRVAHCFSQYNASSGKPYAVACSLGGHLVHALAKESLDEVLSHADRVMYAEKRRRRAQRTAPPPAST